MSDGKVVFEITGNTSGINSALNAATNSIAQQTAKWTVLGQTAMNALVGFARTGFNWIKTLADNAFEYNAQMETYEVNFRTLLGDAEAASRKMVELKEYAAKTPFSFGDLADATQTLLAFGMTSDDASLALKYLGDISLGDANKLKSLTLAFAQVSSAGKLAGQDLLQMINAGFNPLQVIAEKTGVAYADLKAVMSGEKTSDDFNLRVEEARREVEELGVNASESAILLAQIGEEGMISAEIVAAAMRYATGEGGRFYKAMEAASETARGQIATIADSWDMLTGKITGGMFDQLSTSVLPKVITWLDELNAAYDENGFEGLKGAAGGIFAELGTLAFNAGAGILTNIYNGLTGDEKTTEEIKTYLTEIFGVAGDAISGMKEIGLSVLEWVEQHGALVGAAAAIIGGGFAVMTLATNPLAIALVAAAGAIATFTTDWEAFAEKYPNLVASFESITGLDFSTFTASIESCRANVTAFYNDCISPLVEGLNQLAGSDTSGFGGLLLKVQEFGSWFGGAGLVQHWTEIKQAAVDAYTATQTFLTQTVPESWAQFCADVGTAWNTQVLPYIDNAALRAAELLGLSVPADWSLTKTLGESFDSLLIKVTNLLNKIKELLGLTEDNSPQQYVAEATATQEAEAAANDPARHAGKYSPSVYGDDWSYELYWYAKKAIDAGTQSGQERVIDWDLRPSTFTDADWNAFRLDLSAAMQDTNLTIDNIEAWFEDPEGDLQSQLNGTRLTVNVTAVLTSLYTGAIDGIQSVASKAIAGLRGLGHASGGMFTSATSFLGEDGLHTFGESGTEVLLPLDALWRKMGFAFDHAFTANLDRMQYNIMPPLPAAAPTPYEQSDLSEAIAASVREAVSNLTVELDKRKVGKVIAKEVSHEIANDVNGRKWTA